MNKKLLIALVIVAIVASAAFVLLRRTPRSAHELKVSGTMEVTSVELSFKVGGRLSKRLVDEGEMVTAGQLVARLEDDELKDERSARSADQRAARADLPFSGHNWRPWRVSAQRCCWWRSSASGKQWVSNGAGVPLRPVPAPMMRQTCAAAPRAG